MFVNALGNQIFMDCIIGNKDNLDFERINNIIKEDKTELPAGYPRLWFSVYNGQLNILNLRSKVLKSYII